MMTLWPSLWSFTAVSQMSDRVEIRGSCVFSSMIELVPENELVSHKVTKSFSFCAPSLITIVRDRFPFMFEKLLSN